MRDDEEIAHPGEMARFLALPVHFTGGAQALAEGEDGRVVSGGDQCRHVERSPHRLAPALDLSPAAHQPALRPYKRFAGGIRREDQVCRASGPSASDQPIGSTLSRMRNGAQVTASMVRIRLSEGQKAQAPLAPGSFLCPG